MKNFYTRALLTIFCCLSINATYAQVDIVNNDTAICEGQSVMLHANTNGRVPVAIPLDQDDVYADVIVPIGFPFTFYGVTHTECVVSANGFITFDLSTVGAYSSYVLNGPEDVFPGNADARDAILAAFSDIDPSVPGGSIDYATVGVAPNRRFIVSFCNSGLYSCNNLKASFQIVLYETTNLIDIHLISQPAGLCTQWNQGHAVQGVHNADGTLATIVPGRNWDGVWTAYNESRRFTPVGTTGYTQDLIPHAPVPDSLATITWYANNVQVGTGHDFNFSYVTSQQMVAMVTQCQDTMTDTVDVIVNPLPTIIDVDSTNPTQCEAADGTITLYGFFPGQTYTVHYINTNNIPVTVTLTANTQGALVITGLIEGTYLNFYAVSAEGCVSNTWLSIPLFDPPVNIDNAVAVPPTFCEATDGGINLTGLVPGVTYDVTYTYQGNTTTVTLTASNTGIVFIPNLEAGTYTSISASTMGCNSNIVGPVTLVDPLPNIGNPVGFSPTLCRGTDGYMTIDGLLPNTNYIVHYAYNTVPQQQAVVSDGAGVATVTGLAAGVYNQINVQLLSCQSVNRGPITIVNPPVTADFSFVLEPGCTEDVVRFTDLSTGSAYPFEYIWQFDDDSSSTLQNPVHTYEDQGTYSVVLMITDSVCRDTVTHDVVIDHPLVANFNVDNALVCQGTAVNFTDVSTATPPVSYYWDFGNGEINTLGGPAVSSVYPYAGDYTATLIISDFIGCKDTITKEIRVDSLTIINLSLEDNNICAGEEAKIHATYADEGSTGAIWDFGDGIVQTTFTHNIDHSYEIPGSYTIKMTATGRVCPDVEATIPLNVQPQPVLNLGPDTAMCPTSSPVTLNDLINASNPSASWQWKRDNVLQDGENSFMHVANSPAIYTALVTIGECTTADTIWVKNDCYINVPNAFTPDGDNLNDYFFPRDWLSKGVASFKLQIFNRWGQEIFSTTNINGRGWDGKFNGIDQPMGVYVYMIEATFKNGASEKKEGNVTLLR